MARPCMRKFEKPTPDDSLQSAAAQDMPVDELPDWRDSSMDLMRGLDVIELSLDSPAVARQAPASKKDTRAPDSRRVGDSPKRMPRRG